MPDRQSWDQSAFDSAYDTSMSGGDQYGAEYNEGDNPSVFNMNSGWESFNSAIDDISGTLSGQSFDSGNPTKAMFDSLTSPTQQGPMSTPEAGGPKNLIEEILGKASDFYGKQGERTQGAIWSALGALGTQYMNKDLKNAQIDRMRSMTKNDTDRLELERKAYENKIAQQGSTAAALKNAKRPGLINFQPMTVANVGKRIV